MGIEDVEKKQENNPGMLHEEFSFMKVKHIERYIIVLISILVAALLLITFDQLLIAGCLIIGSGCLGLIVLRKSSQLNRRYIESINSFLKTDGKKDKIITDFSHKIREPLNNLVITGDMLLDSQLSNKQTELLETFIASTGSMVTAVNELTMESAENMSYESRKQIRFNIMSAVEHVIELYRLKERVNVVFFLDKRGSGNLECIGDPVSIKQIFLDIFSRIEKFNPDRPGRISINLKAEKTTASESQLEITIDADVSMSIIDEISQEGSHAARLISLSRGKYTQQTDNNSTVLKIYLTMKGVVPEPEKKTSSAKIEQLIQKEKIKKELKDLKILLVEDNIINQKITLLTLNPLVSGIDSATNGKEALDLFGTVNYDLILMDIQMPVMNGLTAIEKIRALELTTNSHVPIIAITANAMIGDKEKCLSAGADDYISKPFQPVQLVEKIKQVI